jgi:hypothetical protein
MKTKLYSFLTALSLLIGIHQASAQGTAFTYQGALDQGGNPANGNFDLRLRLYDAVTGGTLIAGPITNLAVSVSNGLFTTTIDFGDVYTGIDLWLEMGIRTNGGNNFGLLTPRQQLTPTPYSIFATTSSNLAGTVSATQLTGSVSNNQLASSSITINSGAGLGGGGSVALGKSTTLSNTGVLTITGNADITASITGGAVTLGDTATSNNTPGTIVKRDTTGSFSTGSVNLAGNLNLLGSSNGLGIVYSGGVPAFNTTGSQSTFVGQSAGNLTQIATGNTGIGNLALSVVSNGGYNTAVGAYSLFANTNGDYNTACGAEALQDNLGGVDNTAVGYRGLFANLNGKENVAIGFEALDAMTNASFNTAVGTYALTQNLIGNDNTSIGFNTLSSDTNGGQNTALGNASLSANTSGWYNTAAGYHALIGNTTGSNNIGIGYSAGANNGAGSSNIYIGNEGSGGDNNVIRIGSGQSETYIAGTIQNANFGPNVQIGVTSPYTSGFAGPSEALKVQSSESFGVSISDDATFVSGGQDWDMLSTGGTADEGQGKLVFRCDSQNSEPMILTSNRVGIATIDPDATLSVNGSADKPGGGSWSTFSDVRLKDVGTNFTPGLEALEDIRPVHYHYKSNNPLNLPSDPEYIGVVAQEVQTAVPDAVQQSGTGYLVVNNDPIIWTMVNAIKELDQKHQSETKAKDAEIQELKQRLDELEATVKQLTAKK